MTAYPILLTHEQCTVQEIRSILIAPPQASEAKQKLSPPAHPRGKLNARTRQRESGLGAPKREAPMPKQTLPTTKPCLGLMSTYPSPVGTKSQAHEA
jgi:hypothetical protein